MMNRLVSSFFIFWSFLGAVAPSMQLAYHYTLIKGMLRRRSLWPWWLFGLPGYAGKVDHFVGRILRSPEYVFLYKLLDLISHSAATGIL